VNEHDLDELLTQVGHPRPPRPEFERALREELFGTEPLTEMQPEADAVDVVVDGSVAAPRHWSSRRILAVAAIAASIVIAVGWLAVSLRHNDNVEVQGTTQRASVQAACQHFNDTAFADASRSQLLGPLNGQALADPATARTRIERLRAALATLADQLRQAGVINAGISEQLVLAEGNASRALGTLQAGNPGVPEQLKEVENQLEAVQEALTRRGIASCL
jgi:hypothetical protein